MHILVADDDADLRALLASVLAETGHAVETVADGQAAWARLESPAPPDVAVLDWQMPAPDGFELCRRVRELNRAAGSYTYVVLVTAFASPETLVAGFDAGADDFLAKPVAPSNLLARVKVAERILGLERSLRERVSALEQAVRRIERLEGLLPICMYCKQIRTDEDQWQPLDLYMQAQGAAAFTHGLCDPCRREHFPGHSDAAPPSP